MFETVRLESTSTASPADASDIGVTASEGKALWLDAKIAMMKSYSAMTCRGDAEKMKVESSLLIDAIVFGHEFWGLRLHLEIMNLDQCIPVFILSGGLEQPKRGRSATPNVDHIKRHGPMRWSVIVFLRLIGSVP